MEIDLIGGKKLRVSLNAWELEGMSVDLESLAGAGFSSGKKNFFIRLLEEGKSRTGFAPKGAKLFVELYPDNRGGAVIYFTAFHPLATIAGSLRERAPVPPAVFAFEDAEHLCRGIPLLAGRYGQRIYKSSLYRFMEEYRLILYPLDYADGLSVSFLCEYARKVGEGHLLAAYIDEHGSEIVKNDALDVISEHFGD